MSDVICPNCQKNNKPQARFCNFCGFDLVKPPIEDTKPSTKNEFICPQCSKQHSKPLDYCDSCGYPIGISSKDIFEEPAQEVTPIKTHEYTDTEKEIKSPQQPIKHQKKVKTRSSKKISIKKLLFIVLGLIGLSVAIFFIYNFISQETEYQAAFEACQPLKPGDDFSEANQTDLEGELRRDSYFKSGQDYYIADNATLIIPKGRTLIIEPGARVRFGKDAKLIVEGKLSACGQSNRRILLTADTDTGVPGYWQGIEFHESDNNSILGHVSIEYSGGNNHSPIWIDKVDLKLQDLKFNSNAWYSVSIDPDSFPLVRDEIKVENGPSGWEIRGDSLDKSMVWDNFQSYFINGIVEIQENGQLKINEGVTIHFLPSSGLITKGELQAVGNEKSPILFTSVNDSESADNPDPSSGDWYGIKVVGEKSRTNLEYVEIRYAGQESNINSCLWLENATSTFNNIQINQCARFSISLDVLSLPTFSNLSLDETDISKELEIRGTEIGGKVKTTFPRIYATNLQRNLYPIVTGWIRIFADSKLTIEPGTTMLFYGEKNAGIYVEGQLNAGGTSKEPIIFSSWQDNRFNTNKRADPGDWGGLYLKNSTKETVIENVEIRYAGIEGSCVYLENASPTMKDLSIADCAINPISSDINSQPEVNNLEIDNNILKNQWLIRESTSNGRLDIVWNVITSNKENYIIRVIGGMINISPDTKLIIKPDIIVKFKNEAGLKIQGELETEGTKDAPIIFTSWRDPIGGGQEIGPQPGDWQGIWLLGSEKQKNINFLKVIYAGQENRTISCVNLENAKPNLNNLEIDHCAFYPIAGDIISQPPQINISLRDNYPSNAWLIKDSKLQNGQSITWDPLYNQEGLQPVPRLVSNWLNIESGAKLSINKGNIIKFAKDQGLSSFGVLEINGTQDDPVYLTSWRDPQFSNERSVQAGDWGGLYIQDASQDTKIQNTYIKYAGGNARTRGALAMNSSAPQISRLHISDSAWYPISLDILCEPKFDLLELINNFPGDVIEIRESTLNRVGELVWTPYKDSESNLIPRVVTGKLTINTNSSMIVNPDVVVKFNEYGLIDIKGSFTADGSVFTSVTDPDYGAVIQSKKPGWPGISASLSDGIQIIKFSNSKIRYADTGIWIDRIPIEISDTFIEYSSQAAISLDPYTEIKVQGVSLLSNNLNGLVIRGNEISNTNVQWKKIGESSNQIVRIIVDPFFIRENASLTIEPGVVIKFSETGKLVVDGDLLSDTNIEESEFITFTSLSDDDYGGDTDNQSRSPVRGSWQGIEVNINETNAKLELDNLRIRYAVIGLKLFNLVDWFINSLEISDSQLFPVSCDALSVFPFENEAIIFLNNGQEVFSCPTPDQE